MTAVPLDEASPAVQAHLAIIQTVIQRMAANSASCKTWCVTLVAAVLVLLADKSAADVAWVVAFPAFMFATLDAYYLGLEKGFRDAYERFNRRLHSGSLKPEDLYRIEPTASKLKMQMKALASPSIWGFYAALVVVAILVGRLVT